MSITVVDGSLFTRGANNVAPVGVVVSTGSPSLTPNTASAMSMDTNGNLRIVIANPISFGSAGLPNTEVITVQPPGWNVTHVVSNGNVNAVLITSNVGLLNDIEGYNTGNTWVYIKIYDGSPVVGNSLPILTVGIPPGKKVEPDLGGGIYINGGIYIALTSGIADVDANSVSANQAVVNIVHS